jgi:hypothetical protein
MSFDPMSPEEAIAGFPHQRPLPDGLPQPPSDPSVPSFSTDRDGRPKRPLNAYNLYFLERVPEEKLAHPDFTGNQISQLIGQQWAKMDEGERAPYRDQAHALQAKFREEYPDYHYRKASERARPVRPRTKGSVPLDDPQGIETGLKNAFTFLGSQLIANYLLQNRALIGDVAGLGKVPGIDMGYEIA